MIFQDIYSLYYQTVAAILRQSAAGTLTGQDILRLTQEKAFGESILTLPDLLKKWPLLRKDLSTPIQQIPALPVTVLEKRWLRTILSDPRISLFDPPMQSLDDVEPLFSLRDIVYFDRYADGDPYDDPQYRRNFHLILTAIETGRRLSVHFHTGKDSRIRQILLLPHHLEYSDKDDKFRLYGMTSGKPTPIILNLQRVHRCELMEKVNLDRYLDMETRLSALTFILTDERNALERVLLDFSHFEKKTTRLGDGRYQVQLLYDTDDETELLIRVLSYGPLLRVTAPDHFISLIRERLAMQGRWGNHKK